MRPIPTIILLLLLLTSTVNLAQTSSSFNALKKYDIEVDHLPGAYEQGVRVNLICPKGTSVSSTCASWESTSNGGKFYVSKTELIKLSVKTGGKRVDSLFVGLYVIGKEKDRLPVVSLYLDRAKFIDSNGIITGTRTPDGRELGRVWQKSSMPTFVEYHEAGKLDYGNNFRIKPFGGWTLGLKEKSLRIYSDTLLGPKSLKISPFLNKPYTSYKSIVLRTSGSDQRNTRLKDISMCSLAKDLGLDYQDYRQSVLYVNGEYWGIYNIREKINLEFLKYNHGAEKDREITKLLVESGLNSKEYMKMIDFIGQDFPKAVVFDSINSRIDLENYLNYIILQIHIQNVDSRGNVRYWKSKSLDDRWRWIFYDSDLGCANSQVNFNYLEKRLSPTQTDWYNPTWATAILRNLVKHTPVKDLFINQYCLLLATKLNTDTIKKRIDFFAGNIRHEIPDHVKRRGTIYGESVKSWEGQVDYLKRYFDLRYPTAFEHIKSCFGLTQDPVTIRISSSIPGVKAVRLQHTTFLWDKLEGSFFPEVPLILEATELSHMHRFVSWSDGDQKHVKMIAPKKGLQIRAKYARKPFSADHRKIVATTFVLEQSKKDTFYLLGLYNNTPDDIELKNITLAKNGSGERLVIKHITIKAFEQYYLTNKPKRTKKKFGIERCTKTALLPGFDLKGGEWVMLDGKDEILDSLFITVPDSMRYFGKMSEFYRNVKSGKWVFDKEQELPKDTRLLSGKGVGFMLVILIGLIFALITFLVIRRMKKGYWFLLMIVALSANAQQPDRFGLDSVQTKLVDNKGKGYDSLSGLRNVRVVLKNLVYRGGNNNPISVQNPLTLPTLHTLNELGFNDVIYLYSKNYTQYFPKERLDSLKETGMNYACMPKLDSIATRKFLTKVWQKANNENDSLIYIHCWNGWHQSGWLSAMTLMQFCDLDKEMALKYWANNTDRNYVGYTHVKEGILSFKPYPDLQFTPQQKLDHCPCMDTLKLDQLYDLDELLGKKKSSQAQEKPKPAPSDNAVNKSEYYVVRSGDTLSEIARRERTTVNEICRLSGISSSAIIRPGQRLKVR
ncbi:MAG: CotH kinase family protein [Bacteroidota bacterium]